MLNSKEIFTYIESIFVKKLIATILKELKTIKNKRFVCHTLTDVTNVCHAHYCTFLRCIHRLNSTGVVLDKEDGVLPPGNRDTGDANGGCGYYYLHNYYHNYHFIETEAPPPPAGDDDETDVSDIDVDEPDAGNQKMKNKKRQVLGQVTIT